MRTNMKQWVLASLLLSTALLAAGSAYAAPLYFPHVATSIPWQTEIAIINTSDQTVTGTLRGLSDEGQLIETKAVTLSARGRRQITVANEFTNHTDIGYIIFDTTSAAVQGYTKFYREGYYRAAIPAVKEVNTSDIYIPHIDSSAQWWTGVSLVNTTSATKELTITFNTGKSIPYTLNANEHKAFDIASLFNNQSQPDIQSAVIANASGVIGLELFGSTVGSNQLDGILLTDNTASILYYPHVAGDGWWTGIVAYSPSWSYYGITITPYSADGTCLSSKHLYVTGHKYIGTVADLGFPAQTAWFKIESMQYITGFELFGTVNGNQLAAYAGGGGTGAMAGVFAKIEKRGWTDIAFVNTEDSAASVTLTAYNDTGTAVATQMLTVGGHAKAVNRAEAIFSQDISGATYMAYSSDREVVGFQLNGSLDGTMLDGLPALAGGGPQQPSWSATVWQQIAGPEGGDIRVLAIDPANSQVVYAGVDGGGVFKTTDGGTFWTAINTGLTNTNVYALAIDPANSQVVYAGTWGVGVAGTGGGVFKTTNGGASWTAINTGLTNNYVNFLAIDPENSQTVYAGTNNGGIFKTTDGGASWTAVNTGLTSTSISSLAIDPVSSQVVYAGTWIGGVFKTTNGGASWTAINSGIINTGISALAIDPSNSQIVYAGGGGVFKTTNGGASWTAINSGIINTGISALVIDPFNSQVVYVGTTGAFGCGGSGCGPDIPGSVFKTTNGGASWTAINAGITTTSIYSLAINPANNQVIYAGTNNGRIFKTIIGGDFWTAINTGTNGSAQSLAIDPANSQTVYAGGAAGVFKTINGGASWTAINTGITNTSINSLAIDPANSQVVYAGTRTGGVFKTTDGGASWTEINTGLTNNYVHPLAIDPANSRIVYAGTRTGGVFKTTNGGASWTAINTGLTGTKVDSLAIDPANSQVVYAGTYSFGVFKTTNGGASWTAINTGITNTSINSLAIDPTNSRTVYAGTLYDGVFKTTNGGASWTAINTGLTSTSISSLAIDPVSSQVVYAGTGGGVFKMIQEMVYANFTGVGL